jgi:hypothetical protein
MIMRITLIFYKNKRINFLLICKRFYNPLPCCNLLSKHHHHQRLREEVAQGNDSRSLERAWPGMDLEGVLAVVAIAEDIIRYMSICIYT